MQIIHTSARRERDDIDSHPPTPDEISDAYIEWQFWDWTNEAWSDDQLKPERATFVFLGDVPEIEWPAEWLAVPFVGYLNGVPIGMAA